MYGTGDSYGNGESIKTALDCADDPMLDAGYVKVSGGLMSRAFRVAIFNM